ncbi:MAG: alpha/beta hydrolase [Balneolaceae bacterium]|nr:alpha/beta hydrolase [Balneolaceae bacterium]
MIDRFDTDRLLKRFELTRFPDPEPIEIKYPVLLCHGYGAIASLVKPSPLYDVAMLMRTHNVLAFAPNIVPYAKIEIRAESWVEVIKTLVADSNYEKVNIVAHSMGGLDIRYALSHLAISDKVASLTTVSTPHRGTSLAELTLKTPDAIKDKLADFLDWMGNRIFPEGKSDSVGSAKQLTRNYVQEVFNPNTPDSDDVPYYSFSSAIGKGTNQPITVVNRFQNNHIFEQEGINDGMVSVESSKWGEHIKTSNLSHLEQMNLRIKEDRKPLFRTFWLEVLNHLQEKGH